MMKMVVQRVPNHLHLAKSKFLVQLLRIPEGFHYLTHIKNYTLYETQQWLKCKNQEYLQEVERCLLDSLEVLVADDKNYFRFAEIGPSNNY